MRVIVTRPECEAARWVTDLSAHGLDAVALPLIRIAPHADAASLQAAWHRLSGYAAVMFVSVNAVRHFFLAQPPGTASFGGTVSNGRPRCWAPGPGTARALTAAGVAPRQLDAPPADADQFDSEALWQVVAPQVRPGQRILVVRGADAQGRSAGRDWLATQLLAGGVGVDTVLAYERHGPRWDDTALDMVRQASVDGSVWLLSSSESVGHLSALREIDETVNWSQARAVATHPRIVQRALAAGFGVVCASRPELGSVVASIKSMP